MNIQHGVQFDYKGRCKVYKGVETEEEAKKIAEEKDGYYHLTRENNEQGFKSKYTVEYYIGKERK